MKITVTVVSNWLTAATDSTSAFHNHFLRGLWSANGFRHQHDAPTMHWRNFCWHLCTDQHQSSNCSRTCRDGLRHSICRKPNWGGLIDVCRLANQREVGRCRPAWVDSIGGRRSFQTRPCMGGDVGNLLGHLIAWSPSNLLLHSHLVDQDYAPHPL